MRITLAILMSAALPVLAAAQHTPIRHGDAIEAAGYEDYREQAGRFVDGEWRVALETRLATWRPWGRDGPSLRAHVFAAAGAPAKVPGPLLRVTAGEPVRVTMRNTLDDTLIVRGLRDRGQPLPPGAPPAALVALPFVGDSVVIAPGESVDISFTATVPGSYFYFGKTGKPGWSATPLPLFGADAADRALVGVLIVDPPGETPDPDERILLITHWADRENPESWLPAARFLINGRAWPHTERLVYTQGDTIRWRVINQSGSFHPLHLHGFYFQVHAWTSQTGSSFSPLPELPLAVTWPLQPTAAMRMSWVAHEPGNWIFHCHFMRHMSWVQHPPVTEREHAGHDGGGLRGAGHDGGGLRGAGQDGGGLHGAGQDIDMMGGLVIGVTVTAAADHAPPAVAARRRLDLYIGKRDGVFGDQPGYGFVLQDGPEPPAPDSVRFPGSPIMLVRGEPTGIVVHNRADVALGVHWHGLELESRADGVPGWSGMPGSTVPAIAPGDSLAVRITPPRAGTFMYHVHSEPGHQLALGLYGPFIVLEPGEPWDADTDRLFLLGSLGAGDDPPPAVNGQRHPDPIELLAGTTYRLRFMHISPDDEKSVQLLAGDRPVEWQYIARDGADLPPTLRRTRPADLRFIDVGTTHDFLFTPAQPGELTLRIITTFDAGLPAFPRPAPPPHTMEIPVRVR